MTSHIRAIAWELGRRHRWGLSAIAVYVAALAVWRVFILDAGHTITLDSGESFALVVMAPMTSTFMYLLAVFSFGLEGDLARRESIYPARMFTLPVTTAALAGWPMLLGVVAVSAMWLPTRFLAVWPSGMYTPLIWPAALAAAFLAWTQVFMWMPYGLPGLRVIVAVLWLTMIDIVVILAIHYNVSEAKMVAGLVPLIPAAYLAACVTLARARRGDVPDWRRASARPRQIGEGAAVRKPDFPSPARAQLWFEWRRFGWSLPLAVGILLPFQMALLFAATDAPALVFLILVIVLLTPPFMASFTAASTRKSNPYASDSYVLTPFLATRPLTSAALIAAKLKAMLGSTLAAWALVLVATPLGLLLSDTWPIVTQRASAITAFIGMPRATLILLLILCALIASTWKQLVQNLYIGLSGREWIMRASVFLTLVFIVLLGPLLEWIGDHKDVQGELWEALPFILATLVALKMFAAVSVVVPLSHSKLLSDRALVTWAMCWCVVVLGLYGLLVWIVATPFFPNYLLALLAILVIPLSRMSASPLALAWNRHR